MIAPGPTSLRRTAPDGFIVVAVLWILGALATLASIYAVYVSNTAIALAVNDDRIQAESLVSAGVELAAYQLTAVMADARPPQGEFRFRLRRANAVVSFRSESAQIDLNAAPKELLAGLFAALGAGNANASDYADRIIGWRQGPNSDHPDDREASAYRTAGLNYPPRGALFPHVGELWLVLGLPPALVERAIPFVTVYSGRAEINPLVAAPEVIAALPGMTPDRLYAVLRQRAATPHAADILLSLLGPAQSMATIEGSKAVRVRVRISFDNGRRMSSEVVILLLENGDAPFLVLSWRDDFDGEAADQGRGIVLQ